MKIGLLGGTFDPIHSGHLHMARTAERCLRLDRIFFVPAHCPWQKPGVMAPYADRYAMVALALAGQPRWQPIDVPPARFGAPSYTVDEVDCLERCCAGASIVLLLGADAFAGISTWRHSKRLMRRCDLVVFGRSGYDRARLLAALGGLAECRNGNQIRLRGGRVLHWLPRFRAPASSSEVRARLHAGRAVPRAWLPPAVLQYLRRARLYRTIP